MGQPLYSNQPELTEEELTLLWMEQQEQHEKALMSPSMVEELPEDFIEHNVEKVEEEQILKQN